ncbi:26S proteasome regulatory subunit N2 [Angomonas deanei]|nr:26S proteasome regulatory subunit N2 [Angomonas deanei]|eukprot:EPY32319.1 26S proteasome regulatory subunit N2 [Angomonas deanei]
MRARRMDFLEKVLTQYTHQHKNGEILNFAFETANNLIHDITFRRQVLQLLVTLYTEALTTVDYFSLAQCYVFLHDVKGAAKLITQLYGKKEDQALAYQVAFDLFEYSSQEFLSALVAELESTGVIPPTVSNKIEDEEPVEENKLLSVLTGDMTTKLNVKFLYARCAADVHIINQVKRTIGLRAILHNGTIIAHAFMYGGTTIDVFLRENPTWVSKANYWGKFTATASVGVIHRGHVEHAKNVLQQYLPGEQLPTTGLPHGEAGALYALGLVHAPLGVAKSKEVIEYIVGKIKKFPTSEPIVHGGALGLGLAGMGLREESLYDTLFTCLTGGDAIAGEGAAVGCGLLMAGSANPEVTMSLYNLVTEESQKEKIIRGCAMALALVYLGKEGDAMPLVEQLLSSADPWVRLAGCFVLGLAYAGTESTVASERILNIVVKDTNDEVKRNAMMMLGFIHFTNPTLCLDLVRVMSDSYNPHIRYGVAMALGIAGASSGDARIISLLWEMKSDLVDYVRQAVYIALALVLVQRTATECPLVKEFRTMLETKIADRKEDSCSKFGCLLATGILDAGGRNCIFQLHRQRHRLDKAVVGFFLFSQYWYWYPYLLMLSLAMSPTCLIGLNENLEMPEYTFRSNKPADYFAPPKSILQEKKENKTTVKAVVLSTTRKEEEIQQRRRRVSQGENNSSTTVAEKEDEHNQNKTEEGKKDENNNNNKPTKEANFELLQNPARIIVSQFPFITHDVEGARYMPVKGDQARGVCMLKDLHPEMGEHNLLSHTAFDTSLDAPVPAPFQYP